MTYEQMWHSLATLYEEGEAKSIVRLVLEQQFGLTLTDIVCGKVSELSTEDSAVLQEIFSRLMQGEPVQYVLGKALFCGKEFLVTPSVLIPRPETEELCRLVSDHLRENGVADAPAAKVLDIGTGSGCIAITLADRCSDAHVTAWDVSESALSVARRNAVALGVDVDFVLQDMLLPPDDVAIWDVIVSNPPYVCEAEAATMEKNVLAFEPGLALFVPDNDPLLFYKAIISYARKALKPGGKVFFEINPNHASELEQTLKNAHFIDVLLINDQFSKPRIMQASL